MHGSRSVEFFLYKRFFLKILNFAASELRKRHLAQIDRDSLYSYPENIFEDLNNINCGPNLN